MSNLEVSKHIRGHDGFSHGRSRHLMQKRVIVSKLDNVHWRINAPLTGAITVDLIPYLAPSLARVFVNPTSPILAAL